MVNGVNEKKLWTRVYTPTHEKKFSNEARTTLKYLTCELLGSTEVILT